MRKLFRSLPLFVAAWLSGSGDAIAAPNPMDLLDLALHAAQKGTMVELIVGSNGLFSRHLEIEMYWCVPTRNRGHHRFKIGGSVSLEKIFKSEVYSIMLGFAFPANRMIDSRYFPDTALDPVTLQKIE